MKLIITNIYTASPSFFIFLILTIYNISFINFYRLLIFLLIRSIFLLGHQQQNGMKRYIRSFLCVYISQSTPCKVLFLKS